MRNDINGDEWGLTEYHTTLLGAITELNKKRYEIGQQAPSNLYASPQEINVIIDN